MRLADAASYFDKTLCVDATATGTTFYGQLDLFDESKRDGVTVSRRVLSVSPSVVIPASRVITVAGEQWIVGTHQADQFAGAAVRDKYILHRALGVATVKTFGQALSTGGTDTYAGKLWVKDFKEPEQSSGLEGFFNVYLPQGTTVAVGNLILLGARLHSVRNSFLSAAGFLIAESNELPSDAVVSASYAAIVYVPSTDAETLTSTAVSLLRMRFQDHFVNLSASAPKPQPGDFMGFVRKAVIATAAAGAKVTIGSTVYRVVTVSDEGDSWGLHLRYV